MRKMRGMGIYMKKRITKSLVFVLAMAALSGCGKGDSEKEKTTEQVTTEATTVVEETTEATTENVTEEATQSDGDVDYEALYAPIIEANKKFIEEGYDEDKEEDDAYEYVSTGIMEECMYAENSDLLQSIGYVIMDINDDGVSELLIGIDDGYDESGAHSVIYGGYTCIDGKAEVFMEGWARNRYFWMGNGYFYYYGSAGAMNSLFGKCSLEKNSTELVWEDFYFSDAVDDTNVAYYHNKTGDVTDKSEVMDIGDEEFWGLSEQYICKSLPWIRLGDYDDGDVSDMDETVLVEAMYADEVMDDSTDCITYEPVESETAVKVLFNARKEVKNFRLVAVSVVDVDEEGEIDVEYTKTYQLDSLTPELPLCASLEFPGDMPTNGFMYTDENGKEHLFLLEVSGKDGSLVSLEHDL